MVWGPGHCTRNPRNCMVFICLQIGVCICIVHIGDVAISEISKLVHNFSLHEPWQVRMCVCTINSCPDTRNLICIEIPNVNVVETRFLMKVCH